MKLFLPVLTLLVGLISPVSAQDTVQVKTGWNIIGSVKAGAVPDVLSTIPDSIITTSFYGYAPSVGYQSTNTLGKGLGYWVKVKSDGIIIFHTSGNPDACGVKRVDYGGISYGTVQIGGQCWLKENLNVGARIGGYENQSDNGMIEKYCYNNDPAHCIAYGGLYQWNEAMQYVTTEGTRGICPPGWHIPTIADFGALSASVGGDANALKAVGQGIGPGGGAGTNTSGFSAMLVGYRAYIDSSFIFTGEISYFWSSTEYSVNFAYGRRLYSTNSVFLTMGYFDDYAYSVRCVED
jgi:uncharacterized protein (TIGR02145 family)